MPNYDYQCIKCGHTFEQFQRMDDRDLPTKEPCSECGETSSIEIKIGCPSIGDSVRLGLTKPDGGMKEVLDKIQKATGQKFESKFG